MYPELIQQVTILDPLTKTEVVADVLIEGGMIRAIAPQLTNFSPETQVIDGHGLILAPGLVDLYSHSGEPGFEDRETLNSIMAAALAGGFTRLALLPNTFPPVDNASVLRALQQKLEMLGTVPKVYFWGAISQNLQGEKMTELKEIIEGGAIGFSDGLPLDNWGLLRRVLEYIQPLGKPIALVPVNQQLRGNGVMREGVLSIQGGLPGNPVISETVALAGLLALVEGVRTPVHLMGISTKEGVELITKGKEKGLLITASTPWLNLLLDTRSLLDYNPNLRLEPPLGNEGDREALIRGVKEGIIDAIAVHHSPYTYEEKTVAFGDAPPGAIGLELALPLLWQAFVATGQWTPLQLWQSLSVNPLLCLHQNPLSCQVGDLAELILFNPQERWRVARETLKSKSINAFWLGQEITGKVVKVWGS